MNGASKNIDKPGIEKSLDWFIDTEIFDLV